MVSGSKTGISRNSSTFQRVRVVLPEPFAPAIKVSVGRLTGRVGQMERPDCAAAPPKFHSAVFFQ